MPEAWFLCRSDRPPGGTFVVKQRPQFTDASTTPARQPVSGSSTVTCPVSRATLMASVVLPAHHGGSNVIRHVCSTSAHETAVPVLSPQLLANC